jgi:integrase
VSAQPLEGGEPICTNVVRDRPILSHKPLKDNRFSPICCLKRFLFVPPNTASIYGLAYGQERTAKEMRKGRNELSALKIKRLRKQGKKGRHADSAQRGLYIQIGEGGSASWLFKYSRSWCGKHEIGLGSVDDVSLEEARDAAHDNRRLLAKRVNPLEARRAEVSKAALEAANRVTFSEASARFVAANEPAWRNQKHRSQWVNTLRDYAYPILGSLPVAAVDTALVLKVLEPVWTSRPETASRLRGRIESVLDWAAARGYRTTENPARWKGHLAQLLPARSKVAAVRHHPAMPYTDLPGFMAELRAKEVVPARALEFLVLVAGRTGEVVRMRWQEIDFAAKLLVVPAERMKTGKEHRVPLCGRALEILAELPRDGNEHVFLGGRAGRPLADAALLKLMRALRPGFVPHGLRATFKTWATERTGYAREVVEQALAHAIESGVERAYRRTDLIELRRRLMNDWAKFCLSPVVKPGGRVVALRSN